MQPLTIDKQTYTYKSVNATPVQLDIYTTQPLTPRPLLLWIHGGALIYGNRGQLHDYQREIYLRAGYTVASIDYRLAPETKLDQIIEDLRDAHAWIISNGPSLFALAEQRIAVAGHSAGGYLTLMAGICLDPRPKALISFYGYGDIIGPWYSRPDPFYCSQPLVSEQQARQQRDRFYLWCRQTGRWPIEVAGHDPDQEAAWFTPYCPLQNVTDHYPPTLLIHGVPDTDVPYEQSQLMAQELAAHHVPHQFITLPTLGHGFDSQQNAAQSPEIQSIFDQVQSFLRQHL